MTNTEAHNTTEDHARNEAAWRKRMALSPADRKTYYAAYGVGDWATCARLMGEDIGIN